MHRPTHKVEKEAVDRVVGRDSADCRQDFVPMPLISRRNANVPFHLRPPLAGLEDGPELTALGKLTEIRRVIGETGDTSIEAETKVVRCIHDRSFIILSFGQDSIYPVVPKDRKEGAEPG
jgi:hypothetical protein